MGEGFQNMMKKFILLPELALDELAFLFQGFKFVNALVRLI